MKTFQEFLKESNPTLSSAITSNPSKKFGEMIPMFVDSFFESWFVANDVKVLSSKIDRGNHAYFASKDDKYYIFMFDNGKTFNTIKFSSLSEENIKILSKTPDIYPIKNIGENKYEVIKGILTL